MREEKSLTIKLKLILSGLFFFYLFLQMTSKARRTYSIHGSRAAYRGAPRMTQIFLLLLLQPVGSSMLCQEKRRQQEKITAKIYGIFEIVGEKLPKVTNSNQNNCQQLPTTANNCQKLPKAAKTQPKAAKSSQKQPKAAKISQKQP